MDKEFLKISRFDAADYLKNDTDMLDYLDEVRNENDPQGLLQAINTIARAKDIVRSFKNTGIPKENL